MYVDVGVVQ